MGLEKLYVHLWIVIKGRKVWMGHTALFIIVGICLSVQRRMQPGNDGIFKGFPEIGRDSDAEDSEMFNSNGPKHEV